jgi:hypothetical protein
MTPLIYLASPYSDPDPLVRQQRFDAVCKVAARFMREGHFVFSPIAHTHPIAKAGELPLGYDYWHRYDERMFLACDALWVLMLPGWEESMGVRAEIEAAHSLGVSVTYIEP